MLNATAIRMNTFTNDRATSPADGVERFGSIARKSTAKRSCSTRMPTVIRPAMVSNSCLS